MFANRRKPRKVGVEDDDGESNGTASEPVVERPNTKPKQRSKLRHAYQPGGTSMADDGEEEETVIIPKKKLGRNRILETSSQHRLRSIPGLSEDLPIRSGHDEDRPSYSREYLQELRDSTPSTPKMMMSSPASEDERDKALDIRGKFGELATVVPSGSSVIPSEAEIREKKERRARLAKEQDYISLNDVEGGDEEDDWSLARKENTTDTRLVPDDEDFAEGFDEFVEDGRISLGKKAELEQARRRRAEIKELIEGEEESSDEDDSEAERRAAYENAQTRAGMDGLSKKHLQEPSRPKTPPKISSIPRLAACLTNLRATLSTMETTKHQLMKRLDELRQEKVDISMREDEIQKLLKEAGDNYEKLRAEAGLPHGAQNLLMGSDTQSNRGLENLGPASLPPSQPDSDED